jgi:hypothetical protein
MIAFTLKAIDIPKYSTILTLIVILQQ